MRRVDLPRNSQQMPDLSLKAGQSCLVNAILGDQKFIFKSQCQFCQVDISIKAEIQGLEIRTSSRKLQFLSSKAEAVKGVRTQRSECTVKKLEDHLSLVIA